MKTIGILCSLLLSGFALAEHHDKHRFEGTLEAFYSLDPSLREFVGNAHAYVLYPKIAKGGFIFGGAGGDGKVYVNDASGSKLVGKSKLSQITVGAQIGGQVYSELVVFKDAATFNHFKKEKLELSANVSAVAATAGAAKAAAYHNGVAVFVAGAEGLMAEASIGGQKLSFDPL